MSQRLRVALTLGGAVLHLAALVRETTGEQLIEHDAAIEMSGLDDACMVSVDPDHISQIVQNPINNVVKYSPAGSPVQIALMRAAAEATAGVTDRGIGEPERVPVSASP